MSNCIVGLSNFVEFAFCLPPFVELAFSCLPRDAWRSVLCRLTILTELCKNLEVSRKLQGALTFFCAGKITRFLPLVSSGLPTFVELAKSVCRILSNLHFCLLHDVWRSVLCRLTILTELCKNLEVSGKLRRRFDVLLRRQNYAFSYSWLSSGLPTFFCRFGFRALSCFVARSGRSFSTNFSKIVCLS